jgi:hypothetical protein
VPGYLRILVLGGAAQNSFHGLELLGVVFVFPVHFAFHLKHAAVVVDFELANLLFYILLLLLLFHVCCQLIL